MKLNKIFLLAGIALAGVFASCSDDDDYEKGVVASGNQLQTVTFGTKNIMSAELDPADPTSYTITVYRDSAYMAEAVSIPLKVLVNTDSVFVVPATVDFAAGAAEASVVVNFPKAEIGVPYTLEVALDNDAYINPYSANTTKSFVMNIQRVKWNKIGLCEFYDGFASGNGYYAEIEQRDGTYVFRILNPYAGVMSHPEYETYGGLTPNLATAPEKIFFEILPKTAQEDEEGDIYCNVTFDTWKTGLYYSGAYLIYAFLPSDLSDDDAEDDALSVYYPDYDLVYLYPYYYIPGLGGFGEYPLTIVLPNESIPADAKAGDLVEEADEDEDEDEEEE